MIKINQLGSGSRGNATLINIDGTSILIDVGFPYKQLSKRMGRTRPGRLHSVYISHHHHDHVCGLKVLRKQHRRIQVHEHFDMQDFFALPGGGWIKAIPADHDVPCWSFVFGDKDGNKAALITDTGTIPCDSLPYFMGCNVILVEANHEMELLLENNRYSDELKIRVAETHLENGQTKDFLEMVAWPGLEYVVLLHLSEMNNTPALAEYEAQHGLRRAGCEAKVLVSGQGEGCRMLSLI